MPDIMACRMTGSETVRKYLRSEVSQCEQELRRLTLQLSIDREYVESPEAQTGEIDHFRLQVELEQLELEFLNSRLAILKRWQRQ